MKLIRLESQLKTFIKAAWSNDQFLKLKNIANLFQMLVKTKKTRGVSNGILACEVSFQRMRNHMKD